jgi:hypothetical protein
MMPETFEEVLKRHRTAIPAWPAPVRKSALSRVSAGELSATIDRLAKRKMAGGTVSYGRAVREVFGDNPALARAWADRPERSAPSDLEAAIAKAEAAAAGGPAPDVELDRLIRARVKKSAGQLAYSDAMTEVMREHPALARAWRDKPRVRKIQPEPGDLHGTTTADWDRTHESPAGPTKAGAEIDRRIRALREKAPSLSYANALDRVVRDEPTLWERHRAEMNARSEVT